MALSAWVSVFDVSDNEREFTAYLRYLYAQGLRPSRDDWLRETAQRLMGLDSERAESAAFVDPAWTLDRRRLLVAITWPATHGELVLRDTDVENEITGLVDRGYSVLWGDIWKNLESLAWLATWRGSWDRIAGRWNLTGDLLSESARLGLLSTPSGRTVTTTTLDALRSDYRGRAALARQGFVLTWWDIVAVAEGTGFFFEPVDNNQTRRHDPYTNGRYLWDRDGLLRRLGNAFRRHRDLNASLARREAEEEARRTQEFDPPEVHRRISAGGRIEPPPLGSKYRALFEYLDGINFVGSQSTVSLSREVLNELTARVQPGAQRATRGAHGRSGLPKSALRNVQWWYGPWNPDGADSASNWGAVADRRWQELMGKKSQTRAWMAAGLRARPYKPGGSELVSVEFAPVRGREAWWWWREELRTDTYDQMVELWPE